MLKHYLFLIFYTLFSFCVSAQNINTKKIGMISDNDLYTSITLDRYYTNGLEIYFQNLHHTDSITALKKIDTYKIGQKIYNPIYSYLYTLKKIDRPYAGYLYGQYARNFIKPKHTLEVGVELGILGPKSLAEDAQNFIHTFYNLEPSKGWNNQVSEKIGGGIFMNTGYLLSHHKNFENSISGNINISNIYTNITTGINQRINLHKNGLAAYNNSIFNQTNLIPNKEAQKEIFINLNTKVSYQTHDATATHPLENPLQQKDFSIVPWVFSEDIGLFASFKSWDFSYHVIWYTKNVKSMRQMNNRYGSIQIAHRL